MSRKYPSQNLKQVLLRIPEAMRVKLDEEAEESGRSLTAVILARLESTFPQDEEWLSRAAKSPMIKIEKLLLATEAKLEARLAALEAEVAELKRQK